MSTIGIETVTGNPFLSEEVSTFLLNLSSVRQPFTANTTAHLADEAGQGKCTVESRQRASSILDKLASLGHVARLELKQTPPIGRDYLPLYSLTS
jgi:hypothetical protein